MFSETPDRSRPNVFEIDLDAIAGNALEIRILRASARADFRGDEGAWLGGSA